MAGENVCRNLPYLDHIFPDRPDLVDVSAHLPIELGEEVSDPELERETGLRHLVHVDRLQNSLQKIKDDFEKIIPMSPM